MQLGANCLVLDEPTNNLDIPAAEVLEESLENFPGTVIVVSHDRYLLDRLVDRVIEVRDGRIRSFAGGYSNYLEQVNAPPVTATVSEAHAGERASRPHAKRRKG
jgi:ATP-binding cassette subfamily F protein 3